MLKHYAIQVKEKVFILFERTGGILIKWGQRTSKYINNFFAASYLLIQKSCEKIKGILSNDTDSEWNERKEKELPKDCLESKEVSKIMEDLIQEVTISEKVIGDKITVQKIIMENKDLQEIVKQMQYEKKQYFCTIAGTKYLIKVLTLYYSLERCSGNFNLVVCCIDDFIYHVLNNMKLKEVILIDIRSLETDELKKAKSSRTVSEYCWTLKPWLVSYLLDHYKMDSIIYCDSDIYFFSDTKRIYKDWGDASLYLCPQRDLDWVEKKYGTYQAGLIGFKNNSIGKKAAAWWKSRCLEWCYSRDNDEKGRWGDQKYLDQIPRLFADTKISGHFGINAAPWNTVYNNNYKITKKNEDVFIQEYPLVAYHFSCIDIFNKEQYDLWNLSKINIPNVIRNKIYLPYLVRIRSAIEIIEKNIGKKVKMCFSDKEISKAKTYLRYSDFDLKVSKWDHMYYFCTIATEKYVFKILALHHSLISKMENFHLWICCADKQGFAILKSLDLSNVTLVPLEVFESREIKSIKETRQIHEFCWSLKPVFCSHLLNHYNIEKLLYCDADLYFFAHPEKIYEEWKGHATFLTRQNAPADMEQLNGKYQAGLIGFSKNEYSFRVLNWWEEQCLNWCNDKPEPDLKRWGDQKYLDQVPLLFTFIKICKHKGINAAPWNLILNSNYASEIKASENEVLINHDTLIAYHFGSLLIYNDNEFDLWKWEHLNIDYRIMDNIYLPYLKELKNAIHRVKKHKSDVKSLFNNEYPVKDSKNYICLKKD